MSLIYVMKLRSENQGMESEILKNLEFLNFYYQKVVHVVDRMLKKLSCRPHGRFFGSKFLKSVLPLQNEIFIFFRKIYLAIQINFH